MLNVHVGDRVVESGTGSGCMTLALARAVHPTGHIFTYEFNNVRAKTATEEFQRYVKKVFLSSPKTILMSIIGSK